MKGNSRPWIPFIILFVLLNGFFLAGKNWLVRLGIDNEVLIIGNLVLLVATGLSFRISVRSLRSSNPQAPVRAMYGSFIVKFFICVIAAFVYIVTAKKNVNKPELFTLMGLYIVYTFLEVSALTKMLKPKKNA